MSSAQTCLNYPDRVTGSAKTSTSQCKLRKCHDGIRNYDAYRVDFSASILTQLLYNQLSHLDTRHFMIIECRHLANGCVLKCGCIGLMLFHNLSCLDTIICYINTIGIVRHMHATFVTLWLQVVQPLANVHETNWTPHVKRETDVAH